MPLEGLPEQLRQPVRPTISRREFDRGVPRVTVRLLFEAELLAGARGSNYARAEERRTVELTADRLTMKTARELIDKLISWGADPIGFGLKFRRKFATLEQWYAFGWRNHIPELSVTVQMQTRLRRFGAVLEPMGSGED